MIKIKPFIVLAAILFVITLMVPTMLVLPFAEEKAAGQLGEEKDPSPQATEGGNAAEPALEVAVYRTAAKQIEKIPLEKYLVGVVAAEMPADFEKEALKAQVLAARTYILSQMISGKTVGVPEGADVTDTELHQVYKNDQDLKKNWGKDYDWKLKKVTAAVQETAGQILTYEGSPITPTFFSTSNGFTENSEDYWKNSYPYLRSVQSPWDKESPKFTAQKVIPVAQFESTLGVKITDPANFGKTITERTAGKRVGKVKIGGKELTGKDIREKLDLQSSDFSWVLKGENVVITTKGYGHGVGMSQYGANGMASEGKNYQEIVQHYYQGVEITQSDTLLTKITAQK
ncbi:stage II sporulation protein D [Bacillus sp. V3-13]|uniref:stage II sporulation protein D n=1 Tax=Bacillus sp. V3-13 TaxID=2053728 RepID=UPI000C780FBA|nr:stage II sporulation protein D [Bacillus sp. V3-13]PLR76173.1 stage II sporulation protein D [Bacillus sp. V3-13]